MRDYPERGSSNPCPRCGIAMGNQHTLSQSAICDGIKNGHIEVAEGKKMVQKCKG